MVNWSRTQSNHPRQKYNALNKEIKQLKGRNKGDVGEVGDKAWLGL